MAQTHMWAFLLYDVKGFVTSFVFLRLLVLWRAYVSLHKLVFGLKVIYMVWIYMVWICMVWIYMVVLFLVE